MFTAFADASEWTQWWPMMTTSRWTAGAGGIGAEREVAVRMLGSFREQMIAWEPDVRFAFTMIASSSPIASQIAEDYRLTPDGAGTRVDWLLAARPNALGKLATPVVRTVMSRMFVRGMNNLDHLLSAN